MDDLSDPTIGLSSLPREMLQESSWFISLTPFIAPPSTDGKVLHHPFEHRTEEDFIAHPLMDDLSDPSIGLCRFSGGYPESSWIILFTSDFGIHRQAQTTD